jgi:hypothetical protein
LVVARWPFVLIILVHAACGGSSASRTEEVTVWKPLGSWKGSGVLQTDSFISDSGQLRIVWEARGEAGAEPGALRISLHSAVSGRSLAVAVDHKGPGRNTTYITEDPRSFFLVIESTNVEWSVEVAEGVAATRRSSIAAYYLLPTTYYLLINYGAAGTPGTIMMIVGNRSGCAPRFGFG